MTGTRQRSFRLTTVAIAAFAISPAWAAASADDFEWRQTSADPTPISLISHECLSPDQVFGCDGVACDAAVKAHCDDSCFGWGCLHDRATLLPEDNCIDSTFKSVLSVKDHLQFPLTVGGWHWWAIDTTGSGRGGYGYRGYRGTYAYTFTGGPEYEIDRKQSVGVFWNFAARDGVPYRRYYTTNFWFLDAYGWYRHEDLGTLKAGLVTTKFGLDGYGTFLGTAPYFEGYIQDPDYGLSWERNWSVNEQLSVDTYAQYYIHDNGQNGSLTNFDSESVAGVSERNTVVLRSVGNWSLAEDTRLNLGTSFLVGEIDSHLPGFADDVRTVWGVDMTLTRGPFVLKSEFLQRFGRVVPSHFVSGGPSDRMEAWSAEADYRTGPINWVSKYSQSFQSNPDGRQEIISVGAQIDITPNIIFFGEYAWWNVDGNSAGNFNVLEGPQLVIYWHY